MNFHTGTVAAGKDGAVFLRTVF